MKTKEEDKEMETKNQKKEEIGHIQKTNSKAKNQNERIAISKEGSERLDQWISDLEKQNKGIRITRADIVNFLLLDHPETLSSEERSKLGNAHFDDVKFGFWIARTLRMKRANGESVTYDQLYAEHRPSRS
jgi:hypothetical protein